ncbi:MAG: cupin domain-containing protein [Actinomycetota bacterium]|nr:cupin domain-containing protein [Actinomycetota bacterium]
MASATPDTTTSGGFDLSTTAVHLSLGARAVPLEGFDFSPSYLEAYERRFESDGAEGRLVMQYASHADWDVWECHPAGDELVIVVSGRMVLHQELDGGVRSVPLGPGQAAVNPPGVWHTADVVEPASIITITSGRGTEHRPR